MDNEQNNVPYQGTYTGDQIDDAVERALSPHVDKFNGRSGAVTPQAGDYSADKITFTPPNGMESTNVQGAVEELFTSVSEGKSLIASAITDKGVPTEADATFQQIQENILAIETGGGLPENMYSVQVSADPPEGGTVSGGGVASSGMTVTVKAEPADGYALESWEEGGAAVSSDLSYRFEMDSRRELTAVFTDKVLPDGYTELQYIESTGTQHIDTGVIANNNTEVYIDAEMSSSNSLTYLFGCDSSGSSDANGYDMFFSADAMYVVFGKQKAQIIKKYLGKRTVFSIASGKATAGEDETPLESETFTLPFSLYLFTRRYSQTGTISNSKAKVFSCKFCENGEQIRDFVPCKNTSGAIGLYDLVGKQFYGNNGTGAFTAGPAV